MALGPFFCFSFPWEIVNPKAITSGKTTTEFLKKKMILNVNFWPWLGNHGFTNPGPEPPESPENLTLDTMTPILKVIATLPVCKQTLNFQISPQSCR